MSDTKDDALRRMMRSSDRIPKTSFVTAIDLATPYGSRVQGIKITAGTGTMTVTYKTKDSGATTRTETVQVGSELLAEFTEITSVSNVTELVVMISGKSSG